MTAWADALKDSFKAMMARWLTGDDTSLKPFVKLAASSEMVGSVNPYTLAPNSTQAYQSLTVDDTAGGVQFAAFHADTTHVFWTSEAAECRVTFDGSAPTTTNGHVIPVDSCGIWTKALATAAKFIRTGTTSAVIRASQMDGV